MSMHTFNRIFRTARLTPATSLTLRAGAARGEMRRRRKGVAAILAMMFLIMFGSLGAAMAIASRGNITTAATHLHVMRAQGAAETGLAVAAQNLEEAARRFVVSSSNVNDFAWDVWSGGTLPSGTTVVQPTLSNDSGTDPDGIAEALARIHALDTNTFEEEGVTPLLDDDLRFDPASAPSQFLSSDWVRSHAVAIDRAVLTGGAIRPRLAYSVVYAPVRRAGTSDLEAIRVTVTGYDFTYRRGGGDDDETTLRRPVTRTVSQDFVLSKRIRQAIVSSNRVMIGKNVQIVGDLGSRFTQFYEVPATQSGPFPNAHPIVTRSDFRHVDEDLDDWIDRFYEGVADVGRDDNRLRVGDPEDAAALEEINDDLGANAARDVTGDGYVDDFDLFLARFDTSGPGGVPDGRVTLAEYLAIASDQDLFYLVDSSNPDRDRDGRAGYEDGNRNGKFDYGSTSNPSSSPDDDHVDNDDRNLGYLDGILDARDRYSKVRGTLRFRASRGDWEEAQEALDGSVNGGEVVSGQLEGAIRPQQGDDAQAYGLVDDNELPPVDASLFDSDRNTFITNSAGSTTVFAQVADAPLAPQPPGWPDASPYAKRFVALPADTDLDGVPDDADGDGAADSTLPAAYFERMPFNSPAVSDFYYRPVFENMVFVNARIPAGTNALFRNCWFIGVTYVEVAKNSAGNPLDNSHPLWNEYGKLTIPAGQTRPRAAATRVTTLASASNWDTVRPEESIFTNAGGRDAALFLHTGAAGIVQQDPPLDKADIAEAEIPTITGDGYTRLPAPLVLSVPVAVDVYGNPATAPTTHAMRRITNTRPFSNNLRFDSCTFVGSVVSDMPGNYTQVRNKLQFTGATRMLQRPEQLPEEEADALGSLLNFTEEEQDLIDRSSLMVPNYSVDLGSFNSPAEQQLNLRGLIVAGVLDVRGNAMIDGGLLLTFDPQHGSGPLRDASGVAAGNPADFNSTLGYFGPEEGDLEAWGSEEIEAARMSQTGSAIILGWDTNGDGWVDVRYNETGGVAPPGGTAITFEGYGHIQVRFDPDMRLPDGIALPLQFDALPETYREGAQ